MTLKRPFPEDGYDGQHDGSLEDGELPYYPEHSSFSTALPPPPPPHPSDPTHPLRLVAYHSSSQPSLSLLPSSQTLALITSTTTIGRDRDYAPRIRLKSLEVSKNHATIYWDVEMGEWAIVDMASTHGTYIRRHEGEGKTWERLAERGMASLPRQLKDGDQIRVATQRFHVHLHPNLLPCASCTEQIEPHSNLIPLETMPSTETAVDQSIGMVNAKKNNNPGAEFMATKEDKKLGHKRDMKALRERMLVASAANPVNGAGGGMAKKQKTAGGTEIAELENGRTSEAGDEGKTPSAPAYIDRAKMRRSAYGASPFISSRPPSPPPFLPLLTHAPPAAPSYGPGALLYSKMTAAPSALHPDDHTRMGKVIEVRTTSTAGAGIGSGSMMKGVENVSGGDWRSKGRDRIRDRYEGSLGG